MSRCATASSSEAKEVRLLSQAPAPDSRADRDALLAHPGIKVLHHLKAHSRSLDLSHNHLLGEEGLRTILAELCRPQEDEVELESLVLVNCGLGGPGASPSRAPVTAQLTPSLSSTPSPLAGVRWSTASLEMLATYLPLLPELTELLLTNNDLTVLPSSFVAAVLSHPRLRTLGLSTNESLGIVPLGQTHSPLHALLEAYHAHALRAGPEFNLRVLRLDQTSLSGPELGDVLRRIVLLNERGLEELTVNGNEGLGSDVLNAMRRAIEYGPDGGDSGTRSAGRTRGNSFVVKLETRGSDSAVWVSLAAPLLHSLAPAGVPHAVVQSVAVEPPVDISARLHANLLERSLTRDAAGQLLRASRTLLHAFPADDAPASSSTTADRPPRSFPILDFPEEILSAILGAVVDSSALSQRQTAAVLAFARDRGTLDAARRPRGRRREREREEWLRSVGAWWFAP